MIEQLIIKTIEEAKKLNETLPIIVEGDRDIISLKKLGFPGAIIKLNTGDSLLDFCDEIAKKYEEVMILTDWDDKGKELKNTLMRYLRDNGLKYNIAIWQKFLRFAGEISCVEELYPYIHEIEKRIEEKRINIMLND
jgi:5S rRNA maturation endonuclease (ribonuclease M5)